MKLLYLGYDLFADCLNALLAAGHEVMAVYTFPSDGVNDFNDRIRTLAAERGIPLTVAPITADELAAFAAQGCDWMICAGYAYRIPVSTDGGPLRGVNLHPALLPVGRGAWPMPVTILRGLPESGVTLHRIAPRFDEGGIIAQARCPVSSDETLASLTAKLQALAPGLLARFLASPEEAWASAVPQEKGEYWPMPTETEMTITPETDIQTADRILRAFAGAECFYTAGGTSISIRSGCVTDEPTPYPVRGGFIRIRVQ